MSSSHQYPIRLRWAGSSHGPTTTYRSYSREYLVEVEGKPALRGTADPRFLGDAGLHNPEDLFVAALSACHMLTYLAEASRAGLGVVSYQDDAVGSMVFEGNGGRFESAVLRPRVVIRAGDDLELATRLHEVAHRDCFLANSVNFPVRNEPTVVREGEGR